MLKQAIQSNLIDVSIIDPPLCDPLEDVEAGNTPDCISASDGGEWLQPVGQARPECCCWWTVCNGGLLFKLWHPSITLTQ